MNPPDPLLLDTLGRMLDRLCGPAVVTAAEDGAYPDALWSALEEAGMPLAWVPERAGGSGASLADGFACARLAAGAAAPVPLAETLLAGWLLAESGLRAPPGPMTIAPVVPGDAPAIAADGRLSGEVRQVPFASVAGHLAAVCDGESGTVVALVPLARCKLAGHGASLAGEPRGAVRLDAAQAVAVSPPLAGMREALRRMGAALRAQQMAGALSVVLEQSLRYANERVQFGRAIGRFQAVQHNLAVLAGEAAAAGAAADAAAVAIARHGVADRRSFLAIASAKIRAGEAAGAGAAIAHQVHGAMGFTREHSLQHRTRRLWAWRDDFGPEAAWAIELGAQAAAGGADGLWPSLTDV